MLERTLALDLPDAFVDMVSTVLECCAALAGLLDDNVLRRVSRSKDVETIRSALASSEDDLVAHLGASILQQSWWRDRYNSFLKCVSTNAVHEQRVMNTQHLLANLSANATGEGIPGCVQDLAFLSEQLGEGMAEFKEDAKAKLLKYVDAAIKELAEQRWAGDPQTLQDLVMELSLMFPLEKSIAGYSQQLAETLPKDPVVPKKVGRVNSVHVVFLHKM